MNLLGSSEKDLDTGDDASPLEKEQEIKEGSELPIDTETYSCLAFRQEL